MIDRIETIVEKVLEVAIVGLLLAGCVVSWLQAFPQ